jgi:hypothetical protein
VSINENAAETKNNVPIDDKEPIFLTAAMVSSVIVILCIALGYSIRRKKLASKQKGLHSK